MKQIPLRNTKAVALCSDQDYAYLMRWRWSYSKTNGYAVRYTARDGVRKSIWMHREVMSRMLGTPIPAGMQVDHILPEQSARINNQRENLRLATRNQNQWNKGLACNSSSGFKGVNPHLGKFDAHIKFHGKRLHLGRFDTAEEAALMYDLVARILFKEFARLNFPDVQPPDFLYEYLMRLDLRQGEFLQQHGIRIDLLSCSFFPRNAS
jgi:hypothetical protein